MSYSLRCRRCGYTWDPLYKKRTPKVCPKCKSYSWQEGINSQR